MCRLGLVDLDPDDRTLAAQLAGVRYSLTSAGQVQVESKDRMAVSPDRADSVVIGLWGARQSQGLPWIARLVEEARWRPAHPLLAGAESLPAVTAGFAGELPSDLTSDLLTRPW
jgi:hypothetical protein